MFAIFRDKTLGMTSEGMPYQPAGIVTEKYGSGCPSGKDYVVEFIDPFTLSIHKQWRAEREIELTEVEEASWQALRGGYERIEHPLVMVAMP